MLVGDDRLGGGAAPGQALVDPAQGRRQARILIAQPLDQLYEESVRQLGSAQGRQHVRRRLSDAATGAEEAIGDDIGLLARGAAGHHAIRDAPQVLHQDDPERNGHGPELADGERFDLLIRTHEAAQHAGFEQAVSVRHIGPAQPEYPRQAGEGATIELRQLAVVAPWQVRPDVSDLLLDDVEVVDQPFGGRGDLRAIGDRHRAIAEGGDQRRFVGRQPTDQFQTSPVGGADTLRRRQTQGVLLQSLGAEQLGAYRLLVPGPRVLPGKAAQAEASSRLNRQPGWRERHHRRPSPAPERMAPSTTARRSTETRRPASGAPSAPRSSSADSASTTTSACSP